LCRSVVFRRVHNLAIMAGNAQRQSDELEVLEAMYAGNGEFELLGPQPVEATERNLVQVRVRGGADATPWAVVVTLPLGYPADARPSFQFEGFTRAQSAAISEQLDSKGSENAGEECVSDVLLCVDEVVLSALGDASESGVADAGPVVWCRTTVLIDQMNNSKVYLRCLKELCEDGMALSVFYRTINSLNNAKLSAAVDPFRSVYCVLDAPSKALAASFLKGLRTQYTDTGCDGKPTKNGGTVLEEFELEEGAQTLVGFTCVEYRSEDELEGHMKALRNPAPPMSRKGYKALRKEANAP